MKIEVAGHSGCDIEIVNGKEGLYILKSTRNRAYAERLRDQALKQKRFHVQKNSKIKAPRILDIHFDQTGCSVKMEYVYSLNFMAFTENYGFEEIDNFLESIIDFVNSEISLSELRTIDSAVLNSKYTDVRKKILANRAFGKDKDIPAWFAALDEIFSKKYSFQMPVGVCHGDLTLSNILFSANGFYLIDFLDSFLETPLQDVVKLRQDTAFNWSGLMYSGAYDKVRHDLVLKFMDRKIEEAFSGYQWYREAYGVFQLLNFLRILQYAREPKVINYLKKTINNLLVNYET